MFSVCWISGSHFSVLESLRRPTKGERGEREKCKIVATDSHPSDIVVIYNCEATTKIYGQADRQREHKKLSKRKHSTVKGVEQRFFFRHISPHSSPPNCQYLMFNVFVHLLILAVGIIFTWFMHGWGCLLPLCSSLLTSSLHPISLRANKSNIVFFIIHPHLAPDTSYRTFTAFLSFFIHSRMTLKHVFVSALCDEH